LTWLWVAWLLFIIVTFALFEGYALRHDKTTLSRFVWRASKRFPLLPFIAGFIVGVLASHFWWSGIVPFDPA
jgi:hypothetical protein